MIDVTLKVLETTKQGVGETLSEYMTRWKGKASRMVNRPNEKDQINMIIKNLLPAYNNRLLSSPISSFGELCNCGTRIEDAINNGQLEKGESKPLIKKTYGRGVIFSKAPNPVNVSTIIPQQTLAYEKLSSKGFIKPLDPTPCLTSYLLLGTSMNITTSTKNPTIRPVIASTLNTKYKTS